MHITYLDSLHTSLELKNAKNMKEPAIGARRNQSGATLCQFWRNTDDISQGRNLVPGGRNLAPGSDLQLSAWRIFTVLVITFSFLVRFTRFFFLRDRNLILYHMDLKSHVRFKEILNLRAFDILSFSNYLTRSCIYQHNLFIWPQSHMNFNNFIGTYHKRLNSRTSCILLTHFRSKAYFWPVMGICALSGLWHTKPYTSLSYLSKTLL